MQSGDLWNWVNGKVDALKLYLTHLNLPSLRATSIWPRSSRPR